MDKDLLLEKDMKRYKVMRWIYEEYNKTQNRGINLDKLIPNEIDCEKELIEISSYLNDEGLIEKLDDAGILVKITHQGIKEIEKSIRTPQEATKHFSTPTIQNFNTFNSPVGSVQQGNHNVANVQQNFGSTTEEIISLLNKLREHLSDENRQEGLEYIEGIEAEIESEKPSESRMKLFLNGLGGVVKETGKELLIEIGKKIISGEIQFPN